MKLSSSLLALSAAAVVASGHGGLKKNNARHKAYLGRREKVLVRQAPSAVVAATGTMTVIAAASGLPSGAASGGASGTLTASAPAITTPTVPGTEIPPLAQITLGAPIETPLSMFTTFTGGATPPLSGAPPLPTITNFNSSLYPKWDHVPFTNSTQVQQWLSEIDLGNVPNLNLTVDGSCESDEAFAHDQSRCWWTCGGCTRPTDITTCPTKYDWGVSYDDGPSPDTPKLVNYLHDHNITSTFYVVGSRACERPDMLQTEYMHGHEISDHTWSHHPLTTLTNEQIVAELGWTRQVIKDILGVSPRYMRPPYGDIDDRVRGVIAAMGLIPVIWTETDNNTIDFDTDDWKIPAGQANGTSSFAAWEQIVELADNLTTGFIVLAHDLYQQSVDMAVGYILPSALSHQPAFNLMSVIECQHEPRSNAYAEMYVNSSAPGTSGTASGSSENTTKSSGVSVFRGRLGWTVAVGVFGAALGVLCTAL